MRIKLSVVVSFLFGIAVATMMLKGGPFLPSAMSVNAADVTTHEESETPFDPEDLLKEADVYDKHADEIQAEVMKFRRTAASIIHDGPKRYSTGGPIDCCIVEVQSGC